MISEGDKREHAPGKSLWKKGKGIEVLQSLENPAATRERGDESKTCTRISEHKQSHRSRISPKKMKRLSEKSELKKSVEERERPAKKSATEKGREGKWSIGEGKGEDGTKSTIRRKGCLLGRKRKGSQKSVRKRAEGLPWKGK